MTKASPVGDTRTVECQHRDRLLAAIGTAKMNDPTLARYSSAWRELLQVADEVAEEIGAWRIGQ